MLKLLALSLLVAAALCADDKPADPVWPDSFQCKFSEKISAIFSENTKGTYYYDAPSARYRIDRDDCKYDRYQL